MTRGRRSLLAVAVLALVVGCSGPRTPTPGASGTPAPSASGTPVVSVPAAATPRPGAPSPGPGAAASVRATPVPTGVAPAASGPEALAPLPATEPALADFYDQAVGWRTCGAKGQLRCTGVRVPLDYARPHGRTLDLAVARRAATKAPRLGSLFVNPGGPGGSGTGFAAIFQTRGLEQFDIVGWDPRGVGNSSPVRCADGAEADRYVALDLSPDTVVEERALEVGSRRFGQSCLAGTGDVLAHLSTQENARDLDILREVLGETRVSYVGQSYGTMLGAYYAELFPGRVGRFVLDAGVDVTGTAGIASTLGFDRALDAFAARCLAGGACRWGESKPQVIGSIRALLDDLDARPLKVGDRQLTQSLAGTGIAGLLYAGTLATPVLDAALDAARNGDGRLLLLASDKLYGRDATGHYGGMLGAFRAIQCADSARVSVAQAKRAWARDVKQAPVFGYYYGPQLVCPLWPVRSVGPLANVDGAGAPPIVVIGGRNDPATPYEESVDLAKRLRSSVLMTFEGQGHVAYGGKSACIDDAVRRYLLTGTAPPGGLRCGP